MKQFTDRRVDSTQFAHRVRTEQIEFQVGMLICALKRSIRDSSVYKDYTLSHYDELIVVVEQAIRQWLVEKDTKKNFENLISVVHDAINSVSKTMSSNDLADLIKSVDDEFLNLKEVKFINIF